MNDEPSDDELMRRFAAGDASAFDRLYARHQAALYRFVRRLLGRDAAAQADEVFQDAWLKLIDARGRWRARADGGSASLRTWLFTLAHHRAVDCLRKGGREVTAADDDDGDPWHPDAQPWQGWPAADDRLFWRRAGQRLLDCLEQLPLAQKATFLLHHEDGLAVGELAAAQGVAFETAKTRLRYAMSKLRVCMGAYLPVEVSA